MSSKRLEAAIKFVDHYRVNNIEVLHTLLADDLTFDFSPSRSLDNAKSLDKAGYIEFRETMKLVMTGYPLDVKKYIESESDNSKSSITLVGPDFPYLLEFKRGSHTIPAQRNRNGYLQQACIKRFALTLCPVVLVWATGTPKWREEMKDYEVFSEEQWEYVGEFIFMLTVDEKGEKIIKIHEFVDSKGTDTKMWPLAMRALGNFQKLKESGK